MDNVLESYVPRHIRLGLCCVPPVIEGYHDVVEEIPVVDSKGSVVYSSKSIKSVPVHEEMSKYRVSQFRLSALKDAGVPLSVVNINRSSVSTLQELSQICEKLVSAEQVVQRFEQERQERESWLNPDVSVVNK